MVTFIIGFLGGFFYARNMEIVNTYILVQYEKVVKMLHLNSEPTPPPVPKTTKVSKKKTNSKEVNK